MGYALKLSNVDFSGVAVAHVTFENTVPCTSITLDKDTLTFDQVGESKQVTATVAPANTTDTVIWSTSNADVATVADGLITIHGIGNVTITATCGRKTATVQISQTTIKAAGTMKILPNFIPYYYNDKLQLSSTSNTYYAVGNEFTDADTLRVIGGEANTTEAIPVPYGATTLKVATQRNHSIKFHYMYVGDCNDLVDYYNENFPKYISRIADVYSSTGVAVTAGNCVIFELHGSEEDTPAYVYFE